jgi:hypothetical protein
MELLTLLLLLLPLMLLNLDILAAIVLPSLLRV